MSRTAEIKLTVDLDGDDVPTGIAWEASEARNPGPTPCQSMMLSLWDTDKKAIAAIDLWAKDTTIEDMNLYFHQAFHQMADTYYRATKNRDVSKLIHEFGEGFAGTVGLINDGSDRESGSRDRLVDLVSLAKNDGNGSGE